ncbi:MAG: excinuclease ABC subunit A, partial [Myxococcota bacterium]
MSEHSASTHVTTLRGARVHNLKSVDLSIEPGTFLVIAGPSGAGKSSLAFGTLYAEGQRRYVESFSAYARQFLERLERPPMDSLHPVPVAIAVDRSVPVRTSRSTVGTMTDVLDYLKGLWFHRAELQCPGCGERVARDTPETISSDLFANWSGKRVVVTYPEAVGSTEHYLTLRDGWVRSGYRRLHLDGKTLDVDEVPPSKVVSEGQAELVLDRAVVRSEDRARLIEVLETALKRPSATAFVWSADGSRKHYSARLRCESCQREFAPATPGLFSFNSPVGACPTCKGFGRTIELDLDKVIPDRSKTLAGGAIRPFAGASHAWERRELRKGASRADVPMDLPVEQFSERQLKWLI